MSTSFIGEQSRPGFGPASAMRGRSSADVAYTQSWTPARTPLRTRPPTLRRGRSGEQGFATFLVVVLASIALLTLAGALSWSTCNSTLNLRNNQYQRTVLAAEAATEKVLTHMSDDYQRDGDYGNSSHLSEYSTFVPTSTEDSRWANYAFSDGQGNTSRTYVQFIPPTAFRVLDSQYRGLYGYASTWRIISNARETNANFSLSAAVRQDLNMATIPLFQFAIFYNMELEINPGADMTVTGPVHANTNIYTQPSATLIFQSDVTSAGDIIRDKKSTDPTSRTLGTITYQGEHDSDVSALTLPIATNNNATVVHQVLEIPPAGESTTSPMGLQRFYNKADLVIKVTSGGTTVTSGLINNFATAIPSAQYNLFMSTTATFYNKRENKTVNAVQIDVAKLIAWNATNTLLRPIISSGGSRNGDLQILYIDDQRTQTSSTESGVRLINGQTILPSGLTVATPEPLYVQGHYNCPSGALGTTNTSGTKPAALIGDAVTVLSPSWSDANASKALSYRAATSCTVNAAFLAGIVQTTTASYSGGVETFPRFLEDWGNDTFTYNGSMVVMYESQYATALWQGTGATIGIYNPPTRRWAFDMNFRDPSKLPPGTPSIRVLIRGQWATMKPNTVVVN